MARFFSSEAVTEGHPDKVCDIISIPSSTRISHWTRIPASPSKPPQKTDSSSSKAK